MELSVQNGDGKPVQLRASRGASIDCERSTYPGERQIRSNSGPPDCSPAVFYDRRKNRKGRREGSGSKSKLYRCSGATFDAKANGNIRTVTKGALIVCVCLCPWLAQTVKSLEVVPFAVRQRELILTEKIDIEYSMRYETLALRTVSDI